MRSALVTALVARAESSPRSRVRLFLRGLSCDELQFIASFMGACILQSTSGEAVPFRGCPSLTDRVTQDWDHKMILLKEYLCRSGIRQPYIPVSRETHLGLPPRIDAERRI